MRKIIAIINLFLGIFVANAQPKVVDCDPHGFPCTDGTKWHVTSSKEILRHITQAFGQRYYQHCSNGGRVAQEFDGLLDCADTFTNRQTGARCEDDRGLRFVCADFSHREHRKVKAMEP